MEKKVDEKQKSSKQNIIKKIKDNKTVDNYSKLLSDSDSNSNSDSESNSESNFKKNINTHNKLDKNSDIDNNEFELEFDNNDDMDT